MEILKFEQFVNERLFNGGVNRAHTGKLRVEDRLTDTDLEYFEMGERQSFEEFSRKRGLDKTFVWDLLDKLYDHYHDDVVKFVMKKKSVYELTGEETGMPINLKEMGFKEFKYSFVLTDLKNFNLNITYGGYDGIESYSMSVGDGEVERDLTETRFAEQVFRYYIDPVLVMQRVIGKDKDLMIKNMMFDVDKLKDNVFDVCKDAFNLYFEDNGEIHKLEKCSEFFQFAYDSDCNDYLYRPFLIIDIDVVNRFIEIGSDRTTNTIHKITQSDEIYQVIMGAVEDAYDDAVENSELYDGL